MRTLTALAAAAFASAGSDLISGGGGHAKGGGQQRAEARIAAKLADNRAFYAGVSEAPPSRQVLRRLFLDGRGCPRGEQQGASQ